MYFNVYFPERKNRGNIILLNYRGGNRIMPGGGPEGRGGIPGTIGGIPAPRGGPRIPCI